MITLRKSKERGHTRIDWLDSYHTFSFGDYHDPAHKGFSHLRVINDDRVKPGQGFAMHGHRDMEIITLVLEGRLAHKDSMGNGSVIQAGDVQRMSAGTGINHSEYNHSQVEPVHFLQIWILPERKGITPAYEQKTFHPDEKHGRWCLIASRDGREGSVTVRQDVNIYSTVLNEGETLSYQVPEDRAAWIHVATGSVCMDDHPLAEGDGGSLASDIKITLHGLESGTEVLLFDLRKPEEGENR